ncbi:Bug family tripartite tricarboxylate transporter substrate binding protein [Sulfitobacter mediterraneus]|uniref:Bug family tripartite tricarboxylate transporter substrate binding protein n=1 Tax=Sulfitobacter mediterraneus TaxID=83219 RepID=UPI0021A81A5F|nr:tripartite tricarboxylate transporter substrate binding protein [Sulfitobacter mediterraneus]UWR13335.1 tripartite tricarboxylate transporter substrate binding protein [Sulfitobacter mediterraneus]
MGLGLAAAPAQAEYPEKPVTFVLPNGAGGAADINLRIILKHLEKTVPAKLVVKNIKGGATATGTRAAYDAPKDGYTALFFHQAFMGTAAQGILGRQFTDMAPIARAGSVDIMYAAAKEAPFDNLPELIDYAKASPGAVRVGVFLRAHSHMVALKVQDALGVEFNMINIPGGGGPIRAALVGHQIDLGITSVAEASKYFESGDIKPLFVFRPVDVPGLEGLFTAEGAGYGQMADVGSVTNYFWMHREVPEDIRTYWADKIEQVMADPELQAELGQRIIDLRFARGEELQSEVDAQYANTVAVVEKFDLKTGANE